MLMGHGLDEQESAEMSELAWKNMGSNWFYWE
jgi:hypothetical protein